MLILLNGNYFMDDSSVSVRMKNRLYILFIIHILTLSSVLHANEIEYGLFIKSHPVKDMEKTSLILENAKPFKLFKETSLTFDLSVRPENPFGIILRMITNRNENMDLFITPGEDGKYYLMLAINEAVYQMQESILLEQWTPVRLVLSSAGNEFSLSYKNSTLSVPYAISQIENIKISFGLCPFPNYSLYDVSSVNIRNVRIYNNDKPVRYWKLEKHEDNLSYDSIANVPAITNNSKWIIDDYSRWTKFYSKPVKNNSLYAFSSLQGKLYIIPDDQRQLIYCYDIRSGTERIISAKNKHATNPNSSRLIYDQLRNNLIIYNLEDRSTFILSLKQLYWKCNDKSFIPEDFGYYNHSSIYSAADSMLYSFGGYGYLKYNNEWIALNVYNDSVTKMCLPEISPRFYASTVKIDSLLYIFGGKGSKTGRQEIFPQHYIDLYAVNVTNGKTTQLWSMDEVDENFYSGENMIYDEDNKCFYILTDIEDLTLIKLAENRKGYEKMSFFAYDSLAPKAFYRNLYLSPDRQHFQALVVRSTSGNDWLIELYALNYPPLPLYTGTKEQAKEKTVSRLPFFIAGFLFLSSLLLSYFFFKRRKKFFKTLPEKDFKNKTSYSGTDIPKKTKTGYHDFSKQSICFLGEFSVINRKGIEITSRFSPILKDIFVLLILNSTKDKKGVLTGEFTKLFWFDKSKDAAKNNRNVHFSKLRSILNDIGNVEIVSNDRHWKIQLGERLVSCDYIEALNLLSNIKEHLHDETKIENLLEILNRGALLPDVENGWVDNFKRDFSNLVIDVLTDLSQNTAFLLNENIKLKIADILFMHDYLNEDALYLKCSTFLHSGKKGIARNVYENFCKEYFELLRVNYKYSLSDILHKKNIS
ncbi:MAG: hypothetical protein LBS08_05075 [Candidatus Symbiothrix sp.]|jgi:DNA-binding SARP family transcriptional activator|nr:hypothetical protein [Candidatus Symbiothrix sp.]